MYSWRVPFWISGPLKIVATGDLGRLGSPEPVPVMVECPPISWRELLFPGVVVLGAFGLFYRRRLKKPAAGRFSAPD